MTATIPTVTGPANEDWRDSALCAQADWRVFFPEKGESAAEAKQICSRCEVREECRDDALLLPASLDRFGIRGGLSVKERAELRRAAS